MTVESGSIKKIIHAQLKTIGIFDRFKIILTADKPFKLKSEPDIILEAAKHLHVESE